MRPLELTLEGFKSYRRPQTFTFESRTLFGIVGPTGSGKSSILEGMIFGLYGKTPSVESSTKKLINSQEDQARVRLAFEVDGVDWGVLRVIRRKGPSETVLRRLDGAGETVTGDRAVTAQIEEIVGLDFESFRSSVVLPQGEFDRFLKATPTERSRILKGIFRLERVDALREGAKARGQVLDGQIALHRNTLESFPDQPEVLLANLVCDLGDSKKVLEQVRDELPHVIQAEQELKRSAGDLDAVRQQIQQTEAALRRLPPEEQLRDLADRHERALTRAAEAHTGLQDAGSALREAEENLAAVLAETGGDAWITGTESALSARKRLVAASAAAEEELGRRRAALAEAEKVLPARNKSHRDAESAVERARAAVQELQQRHAAHLLRGSLTKGEPCPVCDQEVTAVPESEPLPALSAAQAQVRAAEAALKAAASERDAAVTADALAQDRVRTALAGVEKSNLELAEVERRLQELAPGVKDLPGELARRRSLLEEARAGAAGLRKARDAADAAERAARKDLDAVASRLRDVTAVLLHTSGYLGAGSVSIEAGGLWEAAKQVMEAGSERVDQLRRKAESVQAAARQAAESVGRFRDRFGAAAGEPAMKVLERVQGEVNRLEHRIADVKAGIERRREIEAELLVLEGRRKRFKRLADDFADSKFPAYLLDEQRRLLSRIGSEKFQELTGHYRFDDEGEFQIVDQRTGLVRSPDTLSGGETFLASLSLALALSEAVALEGGRLGCFFLDEGFGYLDHESLDLALDGIEKLADPGRMIGLISHVPGVQARLEDLIVLERLPDGSTDVAQQEGPLGYASLLV